MKEVIQVVNCLKKELMKGILLYFVYDKIIFNVLVFTHYKRGIFANKFVL